MKRILKRIILGVLLIGLIWVTYDVLVISPVEQAEKRVRGELFALDAIGGRLDYQLFLGGQLPTNWASLSNSLAAEAGGGFPLPMDKYFVLQKPVLYDDGCYRGLVFIVRSISGGRSSGHKGRWALLLGQNRGAIPTSETSTNNTVFRIWINENELPSGIRSQLQNGN